MSGIRNGGGNLILRFVYGAQNQQRGNYMEVMREVNVRPVLNGLPNVIPIFY